MTAICEILDDGKKLTKIGKVTPPNKRAVRVRAAPSGVGGPNLVRSIDTRVSVRVAATPRILQTAGILRGMGAHDYQGNVLTAGRFCKFTIPDQHFDRIGTSTTPQYLGSQTCALDTIDAFIEEYKSDS